MNKSILLFLVFFSLIFLSGCSGGGSMGGIFGGGNTPVGPRGDDNIGDGLEVRVSSLDTRNLLQTQSIFFTLTLRNKNFDPIELNQQNIRVRTIPADSSIQYSTIFSPDSIESFYDGLFQGRGSLFISDSVPYSREFSLTVDDVHTTNRAPFLSQDISLFFDINYEENFEYSSNLLINFDRNSIRNSLLKKKGPFTLSNFEIRTTNRGTIMQYVIQGQVSQDSQITFNNIQTQFGQFNLQCSYARESGQFVDEYQITNSLTAQDSRLNVICDIPQSVYEQYREDGDTNFVFETVMDYEHSFTIQRTFRMPRYFE
ncbi:MAG: hypothetical protein LAT82_04155 [Nanoarchaeota archaeon]|nr:hypothetical protein [Nanoarchaeota archaeon]